MPSVGPYVVTLDVNVYIRAAQLMGPNFTLAQFEHELRANAAQLRDPNVFTMLSTLLRPHPDGGEIEVWSGPHILDLSVFKALQPNDHNLPAEDRGLGWTDTQAQQIPALIISIVQSTRGGMVPRNGSHCNPPLDYEDGCVLQCARDAHQGDPLVNRHCLTYDKEFIRKSPDNRITVEEPLNWCQRVSKAKAKSFFSQIIPQ